MSWDAIIMRFGDAKSIDDFPPGFTPPPVADAVTLQQILRRLFPEADHRQELSHLVGDDYWLELIHGCHTDDSGKVSAVSVRSSAGSGAIPHLRALCDALEARLFDIQVSEFADLATGTEDSMKAFAEWRNRASGQQREPR